ncbi:hypothetical protein CIW52_32145 [Mycolicibacterium sp. P9-64]|nr:hypothetical protein CIW52_32145 [Mycolicibacterium sp. P9-64]
MDDLDVGSVAHRADSPIADGTLKHLRQQRFIGLYRRGLQETCHLDRGTDRGRLRKQRSCGTAAMIRVVVLLFHTRL